jgi:DNA-binding MarR family transcriptional regulator
MTTPDLAGVRIDRDALHRYLYRRADSHHRLKTPAKTLAEELGLNYENFTTILHRMADEGRLRRLSGAPNRTKVYLVAPPEDFVKG